MSNQPPSANPQNPSIDDLYSLHTSRPSFDISAFSKDFNYHNNPSRSLDAFSNFIKQRSTEFEVFSNSTTAHNYGIGHEQMQNFFEKRSQEMDALEALVQDWKIEYLKGLMGNFHQRLAELLQKIYQIPQNHVLIRSTPNSSTEYEELQQPHQPSKPNIQQLYDPDSSRPTLDTSSVGATYKQFFSNHDALQAFGKLSRNGEKQSKKALLIWQ
ncbi:MAG: hypothetical protein Q9204_007710, partial [Flavoplaca sp. TL-2023a]